MQKITSLTKNLGVTRIFLIGFPVSSSLRLATLEQSTVTMQVITKVPPRITLKLLVASLPSSGSPPVAAAIAEKTSGAPFPKARKVTPASESLSPNFVVIVSRAGER